MTKIVLINEKNEVLDWELNVKNIEAHRDEIDYFGTITVLALDEDGDIIQDREVANCDVADGLYDAIKEVVGMLNKYDDECDVIKVSYKFHTWRVAN
jgi:hypothetical protein